uniref:DEK-C domain-containing protein n=1 Tax=Oryza barthii TaxID=65489 RepID=A0A0D3ET21_9ORYZ
MDEETQKKVESTVLEILRGSDMESLTEFKVRTAAADRLGIDLSIPDRKRFVRRVVEGYLESLSQEDEQEQQQEQAEERGGGTKREYDDEGDLILCRLSARRRVTLQEFKGKTLLSIREYYFKDGKELPAKGISLTVEQWEAFRDSVPAIEDAIKKLGESSD